MFEVVHDEAARRFEIQADGHTAGLSYRIDGDRILLLHTWVPAAVEGRGIGSALVRAAITDAREKGLTVVPVCGFIRHWLEMHSDERET